MTEPVACRPLLEEIREALASVPAGPWCWRGTSSSPVLVTKHSGQLYLLGVSGAYDECEGCGRLPLDVNLQFRHQPPGSDFAILESAGHMIIPRAPYDLDTVRDIENPVARWIKNSPEYVEQLLNEVDWLREQLAREAAIRAHPAGGAAHMTFPF
jgi:hypothetical protein